MKYQLSQMTEKNGPDKLQTEPFLKRLRRKGTYERTNNIRRTYE